MSHLLSSFLGRRTLFGFAALVGALTVASPRSFAQGAGGGPFSMSSSKSGGDGPYRSL
ncbi:MAG: hypothetical protein RL011_432, partial [Pseudomonadota bacterium]